MSFLSVTPPPPPKTKMGKKKSDIYSCFQILPVKNKANKSIFMCKFCDRQYLQNATKMESHIVTQCQKVPPDVRTSYAKAPGGGPRPTVRAPGSNAPTPTNTSSPASDTSDSRPQTPVNLSHISAANRARMTSSNAVGVPRAHVNNSNNIVIKRAASGNLVAHLPRVSPQVRTDSLLQGNNNAEMFQRNNGNHVGQNQKRLKLVVDGLKNHHHHNNHNNNHLSSSNNNYHIHQRQQQLFNNKRVPVKALNLKHLNSMSNNTARSNVTSIPNLDSSPPVVDHKEMVEIWKLLSKGIYATGCPLSIMENEHWKEALKKMRPGLTLPTTYALSNTLLQEEYVKIRRDVHNLISQCNFVTLQCESHAGNSPEEKILSFFVTTPSPILYRTLTVKAEEISTKGKLSEAISSTIDDIGSTKVLAFISDLSPNMKSSWENLRSKYPGLLTFGCILQGLNTLLDEFLEEPSIKEMCHKGKAIVDKTKGSSGLKSRFQKIQRQLKLAPVTGFKFSSKSKWASLAKCLTLLISQKAAFKVLVTSPEAKDFFEEEGDLSFEDLVEFTGDEDFWKGIDGITNIIVPLSNWIKIMEPDSSPSISRLPQIFHELKSAYENNLSNLPLDSELQQSFLKQLTQTRRLCMNELHCAACLLNPKLKSKGVLSEDEEEEGSEFIHYFCETRDLDAQSSLKELVEYRTNLGIFGKPNVWKLAETLDPVPWWNSVRPGSALQTVAAHILTISPPLSTFDRQALFGSVPSNQVELETEKIDKLAFIKYHLQSPKKTPDSLPTEPAPRGQAMAMSKEWSPQPEFKLEDQEPMDVTQYLSQAPGIYTDSEDEGDTDTKNNNINSNAHIESKPNSILSNLMRGLPKVQKDEVNNEIEAVGVNDNDDNDSSSSDSDGSSSGNTSSSASESTKPHL